MASKTNTFKVCIKTILILSIASITVECKSDRLSSSDAAKFRDFDGYANSSGGHFGNGRTRQDGGRFDWARDDFVMTDTLADGENEKRIQFGDICAKETSVGKNGLGVVLRQLTDGRHFLQTISNMAGEMVDCEYIQDATTVRKFLRDFKRDISSYFVKRNNQSIQKDNKKQKRNKYFTKLGRKTKERRTNVRNNHRHNDKMEADYYADLYNSGAWNDFDSTDDDFDVLEDNYSSDDSDDFKPLFAKIRTERNVYAEDEVNPKFRFRKRGKGKINFLAKNDAVSTEFRNVTVLIVGDDSDLPEDLAEWLNLRKMEAKCDQVHKNLQKSLGFSDDNLEDGHRIPEAMRSTGRSRRGLLIVPGTLWCGAGQLAESPRELGELHAPDVCCRAHDLCAGGLPALRHRDGLVNYRPFTVSRCICDRRFRACLKLANTDAANMVGRLFFNVVQTKCFVLKPAKVCLQRSWWGKCLRVGYSKQAHLRENPSF